MVKVSTIYTIQAPDAPQHTGKLQEILQKLKAEKRVSGFSILDANADLSSLMDKIEDEDLILILLTDQLEPRKEQIESNLRDFKAKRPDIKVAEIIVDNVPYENAFITLPPDLRPFRDREDMDAAWNSVEKSLRDMFPAKKEPAPVPPVPWKKYIKYAALLLLATALIWVAIKIFSGGGPEAQFTYYVGDSNQDTITACYPPCDVQFINQSQDYKSSQWTIGDSVFKNKHIHLEFLQPGEVTIALTVFDNKKKDVHKKKLLVKTPPLASFEIKNNGCTAPCPVEFVNESTGATKYSWNFGNTETSAEDQPSEIEYNSPGTYEVKLTAENSDGIIADTVQIVTIIQDDSPFADFAYSGTTGKLPRKVTFKNNSQNADSYVWQFPDGKASGSKNPTFTFNNYGTYSVTLTAKKNDGRSDPEVKAVTIRKHFLKEYQIKANKITDARIRIGL